MASIATVRPGSARLRLVNTDGHLRHHVGDQEDDDHDGDQRDDGRVEHRAEQLGLAAPGALPGRRPVFPAPRRARRSVRRRRPRRGRPRRTRAARWPARAQTGEPALTSLFRCATSSRWRGSSDSSASAVSARSSGRPGADQAGHLPRPHRQRGGVEDARALKRARAAPSLRGAAATCVTASGTSACARNWSARALAFSASSRPAAGLAGGVEALRSA